MSGPAWAGHGQLVEPVLRTWPPLVFIRDVLVTSGWRCHLLRSKLDGGKSWSGRLRPCCGNSRLGVVRVTHTVSRPRFSSFGLQLLVHLYVRGSLRGRTMWLALPRRCYQASLSWRHCIRPPQTMLRVCPESVGRRSARLSKSKSKILGMDMEVGSPSVCSVSNSSPRLWK